MPRVNIRERNPARYASVQAEQDRLRKQYSSLYTVARICPFCDHKIEILYRGSHGSANIKCPNCGEEVLFPPVEFRITG